MQQLLLQEILNYTLSVVRPFCWHDGRLPWPKPVSNASCFILRFPQMLVGVLADHVLRVLEGDLEKYPDVVCQLGCLPLNIHERIIDRDRDLDIATFSINDTELRRIPIIPIDCSAEQLVLKPKPLQAISLAGFPEETRELNANGSATFRAYGALAAVEDVSDREILVTYDPSRDVGVETGINQPPLGFNMSGCSGGPALAIGVRNGLQRWFICGMIMSGSGPVSTGDSMSFDTIRIRRTLFIRQDGTLFRPSTGWLP